MPTLSPLSRVVLTAATALALLAGAAGRGDAQTKIETAIEREIAQRGRTRVVIVMRPDPEAANGGPQIARPADYARALHQGVSHVSAIGSLPAVSAEIDGQVLTRLRDDPNVARVIRDIPVPPSLVESVAAIGGPEVYAAGFRGSGVSVAVLDTGVSRVHPALAPAIVAEACFSTTQSAVWRVRTLCPEGLSVHLLAGAARGCPADVDGCEHGTHVAGIVAGRGMSEGGREFNGLAPAANVVAVQVFTLFEDATACGAAGRCVLSFTSDQLRALDWVSKVREQHRIAAVNMSLGGGYHDRPCDGQSALTEVVERLRSKGVATVAAAGNEAFYDGVAEPACISHAVAVAATNRAGQIDVRYSNVAPFVTLAAPGTDILSSVGDSGYRRLTGTSMAAPHVAAAYALLREAHPKASATVLIDKLKSAGAPITDPRTGTRVPRLALGRAIVQPDEQLVASAQPRAPAAPASDRPTAPATTPTPATPATPTAPATPPPAATPRLPDYGDSGSFIVRSTRTVAEIEEILKKELPGWACNVRRIGADTYKIEGAKPVEGDRAQRLTREVLEQVLSGRADTRIFDNRLSAPKYGK